MGRLQCRVKVHGVVHAKNSAACGEWVRMRRRRMDEGRWRRGGGGEAEEEERIGQGRKG